AAARGGVFPPSAGAPWPRRKARPETIDSNPAVRRIADIRKKSLLTRIIAPPFEAALCRARKPRPESLPNARSMTHAEFPRKALGPRASFPARRPSRAVIFAVRLAAQPLRWVSSLASIDMGPSEGRHNHEALSMESRRDSLCPGVCGNVGQACGG